ncbi:MAG: hypothetical protein ACREPE_00510 [Lysobacter sp.]
MSEVYQGTKNVQAGGSAAGRSDRLPDSGNTIRSPTTPALSSKGTQVPLSVAEIKQRAERGDPVFQRELSGLYEECSAYSLNPSVYLKTLDDLSKLSPGSAKSMERIKARQTALCTQVDNGAPIPREAYQLWLEQAARGGDLTARIRLKARSLEDVPVNEIEVLAGAAIAGKDPSALFELGALMGRPSSAAMSGPLGAVAGTPYSEYAWGIKACRMGAPCGEGSALMTSLCVNTGRCNYANYESFMRSEVGAGGWEKVESALDGINRIVSQ